MFSRNIWEEALCVARANLAVIAFVVLAFIALFILDERFKASSSSMSIASTFLWTGLALMSHSTVLNGKSGLSADYKVYRAFLWRTVALGALVIVPTVLAALFFASYGMLWLYIGGLSIGAIASLLIGSKWGTWLPAVVAGGDTGFVEAGKRGKRTFGYVFGRLSVGPGLLMIASFVAYALVLSSLDSQEIWPTTGLNIQGLLSTIIFLIVQAYIVVMIAVILSRAYLIAENKAAAAVPLPPLRQSGA